MKRAQRPLAVTMGEPAGIGPELILKAWKERYERDLPEFYVVADPEFLKARAKELGINVPVKVVEPEDALPVFHSSLPVFPLSSSVKCQAGEPDSKNAAAVIESIRTCVAHVLERKAEALVTNPIAKSVLYEAGFEHPGHTEYLAHLSHELYSVHAEPVMLLAGPDLMTVPLTVHIPLKDVPAALTEELIITKARIVHNDMRRRFGLTSPRLAICGLNPHAGEDGTMGREDREIIAPAVRKLQDEGINASGPFPGDTLFHREARKTYDVALATYHDQALIPVKTIAFDDTVNVTLGLPFVRTSPDHGTAFGLAGTGKASANSLSAALRLALALAEPELV
ncbi:4-hydroxythreonine-4-phosphate dehydrogenase PdxA [Rhodobacteraceae bacterium RKSG542]|nr:4-hydroxythreonine-4-phosphate dehydrogenase PdxA [Pseudovibrio flavus]